MNIKLGKRNPKRCVQHHQPHFGEDLQACGCKSKKLNKQIQTNFLNSVLLN